MELHKGQEAAVPSQTICPVKCLPPWEFQVRHFRHYDYGSHLHPTSEEELKAVYIPFQPHHNPVKYVRLRVCDLHEVTQ